MSSGGDHRQSLNPETGLNDYGVSPVPREGIPFGSCTASWSSDLAWDAASALLERWRDAGDRAEEDFAAHAGEVRQRLADAFDLRDGGAIALTPSGTDAVFVVSSLALAQGPERVHHLVVGAGELGSGTLGAARGDAFTAERPVGPDGGFDIGLSGLSERCTAQPFYLRGTDGKELEPGVVDAAVADAAEAAIADGATVVIHMVAHSKTGLRAPSVDQLTQLTERHGDRIIVLMDAAQGRVAPVDFRRALDMDFIVLFTGSKFYSGPPFSSALFLPPKFSADPGRLPDGLNQWLTMADIPDSWTNASAGLSVAANPGLLLRWEAALAEIEAYHSIAPDRRSRVYHTFASAVMGSFGPASFVELEVPMPPVHQLASGLGAFPSVLSIKVKRPDGTSLSREELRVLHDQLDTSLEAEGPAARTRFHLGQVVALGPPQEHPNAVLRIALGARLVRELAELPDSGALWFRDRCEELLAKIEMLTQQPTQQVGTP